MNLNEMAARVHKANAKWWQDIHTGEPVDRNKGELLMLVITELAEAVEGIRKNLMDDKLPHRRMEEVEMADAFIRLLDYAAGFEIGNLGDPETYENIHPEDFTRLTNKAEAVLMIADQILDIYKAEYEQAFEVSITISMIIEYCDWHGLDLMGAYEEKMAFNAIRADHQHEARLAANGKKF